MRDFTYNYKKKVFIIHTAELKNLLKDITEITDLYSDNLNISIKLDELKIFWKVIKNKSNEPSLSKLTKFLEKIIKDDLTIFNNMLSDNKILYKYLSYYFEPEMKVLWFDERNSCYVAGKLTKCCYSKRGYDDEKSVDDCYKDRFDMIAEYFRSNGRIFDDCTIGNYVFRSDKTLNIKDLPFYKLTDKQFEHFQTSNEKYIEYLTGIHFLHMKGKMFNNCGNSFSFSGRIVVDQEHYAKIDNDEDEEEDLFEENIIKEELDEQGNIISKEMTKQELIKSQNELKIKGNEWRVFPYIGVYSLDYKIWGSAHASKFSKINFRQDAFNKVVMKPEKKQLIKKVIEFGYKNNLKNTTQWDDIIENKSGGLIFLLHGLPGLGKTLIAESSAELLNRPLISITAGQLGTDDREIEGYLGMYLKRAKRWNAILLIDEADVFMEERDSNIQRNALVTIFLRMLERFDGILFLTTNRVNNIDIAIKSRMSIILDYKPFTQDERKQVWENLLVNTNNQLSESDLIELSKIELNGREIKHCIKMAIATSDEGNSITIENIKNVLQYVLF